MWTAVNFVMPPRLQHLFNVVQSKKLVHVRTLIAQSPVERLDHPVLGGLSRADEIELHPARVALLVERHLVQRIDHALPIQREVHLQRDALPMPLVDDRKNPELPSVG